jgi:hypothetical protein
LQVGGWKLGTSIATRPGFQSYIGRLEPGDRLPQARKLEPTQLGSSLCLFTNKELPVVIEDVRLALTEQDLVLVEQGAPPVVRRSAPLPLLLQLPLKQRHLSLEGSKGKVLPVGGRSKWIDFETDPRRPTVLIKAH